MLANCLLARKRESEGSSERSLGADARECMGSFLISAPVLLRGHFCSGILAPDAVLTLGIVSEKGFRWRRVFGANGGAKAKGKVGGKAQRKGQVGRYSEVARSWAGPSEAATLEGSPDVHRGRADVLLAVDDAVFHYEGYFL
jgi:hypothetical protein